MSVCPNCLSRTLVPTPDRDSPAGPLSRIVLQFECETCRWVFYRANPSVAGTLDRSDLSLCQSRPAA